MIRDNMGTLKSVLLIGILVAIVAALFGVIYYRIDKDTDIDFDIRPEAGNDRTVYVGETVIFTGRNAAPLTAQDKYPDVEYTWDFGDGSTSKEQNPSHSYDEDGSYSVKFTITVDRSKETDDLIVKVLKWKNKAPVADFTVSSNNVNVSDMVQFDATVTSDDHDSLRSLDFSWDLDNDGIEDSTEKVEYFAYSDPGEYIVTLTVTDTEGESDTASDVVYVTEKENPDYVEVEPEGGGGGSIGPNNAVSDSSVTFNWEMTPDMADGLVRVEIFVVWEDTGWDLDLSTGKGAQSAGGEIYASDDGGAEGSGEGNVSLDVDEQDHLEVVDDEQWFAEVATKENARSAGGERLSTDTCEFTVRVILWYV